MFINDFRLGGLPWYSRQLERVNNMPVMGSKPRMDRPPVELILVESLYRSAWSA